MIVETFSPSPGTTFNIEITPAAADGKRYPVIVLVHGNFGLSAPFGAQLRDFTKEVADLGYLAALPTYYPDDQPHLTDTDIAGHLPALTAAVAHLSGRSDADLTRFALVGFSLGGGVAMSYINASPAGAVTVFADFYGLLPPGLLGPPGVGAGVAKFPPTILFHNENDPLVPVAENSEPLADALASAGIVHDPVRPYQWYKDDWDQGAFHAFRPGGPADVNSRTRTKTWLATHMPPTGRP